MDLTLCWERGADLAAQALKEKGLYTAAETNFKEIAAATTHAVPPAPRKPGSGVVLEGRATMMMPFGPNYDDNGRPGVSADIVPRRV